MPRSSLNSETLFRQALDLSLDGFGILRCHRKNKEIIDFYWEYANPAIAKLFKKERSSLLGKSLLKTLPGCKNSGMFDSFVRVVETGDPCDQEVSYKIENFSGWCQNMAIKLGDGLGVFVRDITERKIWEEQLRLSESRFRVLSESNMLALAFWGENTQILEVNKAFVDLLGYKRAEVFLRGISLRDLIPEDRRGEEFTILLKEVEEKGSCAPFEEEFIHKDGHHISVLVGIARLKAINYEGVVFAVDISEKKEFEKQREIFLGHELKNPLACIKGFSDLLLKDLDQKEDKKAIYYLNKINDKVETLTKLINDLTDFTRIKSDKLEYKDEIINVDDLIKTVVSDSQATTTEHQIILKGETQVSLLIDKTRFAQVLSNVISNAIKYSPAATKIIVQCFVGSKEIIISVQDFGLGIPKEEQKNIFEPFYRSKISKEIASGIGLGLYITRRILAHYKGSIHFQSEQGKGTTFFIHLPIRSNNRARKSGQKSADQNKNNRSQRRDYQTPEIKSGNSRQSQQVG